MIYYSVRVGSDSRFRGVLRIKGTLGYVRGVFGYLLVMEGVCDR